MKKLNTLTTLTSLVAIFSLVACGVSIDNDETEGSGGLGGANCESNTGGTLSGTGGTDSGTGGVGGGTGGSDSATPGEGEGGASPTCDAQAPKPVLYLTGNTDFEESITAADALVSGDVTIAEAKFDNGMNFGPKSGGSYLTAAANPDAELGTSDFSVAFWVKMSSGFEILDKRETSSLTGYSIYVYNGNVGLQLANDGQYFNFNSTAIQKVNDGAWHHVAVTVDRDSATGLKFYQDGALIGTMNPTAYQGTLTSDAPLYVGANAYSQSSTSLNGTLDELQIYKSVLSADDVALLGANASFDFCP